MRRLPALPALIAACLVAAACGGVHHASNGGASQPHRAGLTVMPPRSATGGQPVVAMPQVRELQVSQRYGSAAVPAVGVILTTTNGSWAHTPTSYTYQWQQCNSSGGSCTNIGRATAISYTIASDDLGRTIRVAVTATNTSGSTTTDSAVTGVVQAAPAAAVDVAQFNMIDDNNSTPITYSQASGYQIVQLQYSPSVHTLVASIHAHDPGVKVLMYSDPTVPGVGGSYDGWTTCTTSTQDTTGGNSWWLYDDTSQITGKMNPGNPSYDTACVNTADSLAESQGFDGIFWDEINAVPAFAKLPTCINAYGQPACSLYSGGSMTAWQSNFYTLIQAIGTSDTSTGLMSILNIGGADGSAGLAPTSVWDQWNGPVDGAMEESFVGAYNGSSVDYAQVEGEIANEAWSEAHNKYEMAVHYDLDQTHESLDTYGLATMLLAANGYTSYLSTEPSLNIADPTAWPEYTEAKSLGAPDGAYTTVTSGSATVYERRFANGLVIVNPTMSASGSVALGGTYSGTGTEPTSITSLTLGAQTGYVLTTS